MWLAALIFLLVISACSRPRNSEEVAEAPAETPETTAPLAVEAITIERTQFLSAIEASGTIRGIEEAAIVAETQGVIEEVLVDIGEHVTEGQILLRFDESIERFSLHQAESQHEATQTELDSVENLFEIGSSSPLAVARARAATAGARVALERARQAFNNRSIKAPFSGQIASIGVNVSRGNYVGLGMTLMRVVNTDSLRLDVGIGEREIGFIRVGAPAAISIPACGTQSARGNVQSVASGSNLADGSFLVIIQWKNTCENAARSGLSATAKIDPSGDEPVIVAPLLAIQRASSSTHVFTVQDGIAKRRPITIGRNLGNRAEVIEGLQENEVVIITRLTSLQEGMPVTATIIGTSRDLL